MTLILVSLVLQVLAASLAVRLALVTRHRWAWGVVALALVLMAIRRGLTLVHAADNTPVLQSAALSEILALCIALLLIAGLAAQAPRLGAAADAEQRARASEERYRQIVETMLDGVWIIDPQGVTSFVNGQMANMLGYQCEEMVGRPMHDFTDERGREISDRHLARQAQGFEEHRQLEFRHRDGRRIPALLATGPLRDAAGHYAGALAIVTDLTAMRRAEAALRASEARSRDLIEITRTGYVIVNDRGRVLDANQAYVHLTGHQHLAEIHGRTVMEWTAPHDLERNAAEVRKAAESGSVFGLEVDYRWPDGTVVPIEINAVVTEDGSIMALCRDISERRRAANAEREAAQRMRALVEASALPIVGIAGDGTVTGWNPAAERVFGFTAAEAVGRILPIVGPEQEREFRAFLAEVVAGGAFLGRATQRRHKDGTIVEVTISTAPVRDPDGRVVGLVAIYEDVTERLRMERTNQGLEDRLRKAEQLESLGVLAGGIAHDFNNLLTLILGNVHLAREYAPPGSAGAQSLREIELATLRAAELTSQMLAYAGKGRFVLGPVHLSTLARSHAVALQSSLPTGLRLRLDLMQEVPIIEADPAQLRQVLTNLVTNAVEATIGGEGTVTIRTGVIEVDRAYLLGTVLPQGLREGRYVFLEVNDTGEGIPSGIQQRIFEPFFSTRFTGRGLGLAAVVGIVRHLGGTIHLESTPGFGTTMRVLFPTGAALLAAASRPTGPAPEEGTILLVDHETELVRLMQRFLVRAGFRVRTASGGEETMKEFRGERHRLTAVVLDLAGKAASDQALAAIRGLDSEIPIVVTSGYSEAEVAGQLAGLGVSAFLPKPYLPAELIDELRRGITAARARPPGNRVPESR